MTPAFHFAMVPVVRETKTAILVFDGSLMRVTYRAEADVTQADAREHMDLMRELTQGQRVKVLVDTRNMRSLGREARAIYASEESRGYTACCALLVGSPVSRVLGSFFLGFNKPLYPTKLFTSDVDALEWMNGVLAEAHA
ncbi:MAG: STAS/SEC14 domain-containing protein [Myxococcaceae bacterium]